jgi:hypothetical protein
MSKSSDYSCMIGGLCTSSVYSKIDSNGLLI